MEDGLHFWKMEDDLNFWKREDNLHFFLQIEDVFNNLVNGKQPPKF